MDADGHKGWRRLSAILPGGRARMLRDLVARLESATGVRTDGPLPARIAGVAQWVEAASVARRPAHRHAISGLPTREPLLARISADGRGVLGAVAFDDFDRLCAFDIASGEHALRAIVERMRRMLPPDRMIAQVDRGHFAIWFGPGMAADAAAMELDAIAYALGDAIAGPDGDILPEIRVRRAVFPDDDGDARALLARTLASFAVRPGMVPTPAADGALVGGAAAARERYAMEQDLRRAAERGEFALHFQPLVDAGAGRVCGAEALIRWHHPIHGPVPPSRFVPLIEAMGLAHDMGMWALNTAARAARGWAQDGLGPLRVAVNLSAHQLEHDDLCALVERTLARHSIGADALEIELTESVAMADGLRAARLFRALRGIGVRIAIDDFGTGYSSFSTLRTLAFDKIKIDREFVTAVDTRRDSQAICQSIVALGRGLGIRVLAEGVERCEEYEWLRRNGCTHFQGYYFSAPLEGARFAAFVRDRAGLARRLAPGAHADGRRIIERSNA